MNNNDETGGRSVASDLREGELNQRMAQLAPAPRAVFHTFIWFGALMVLISILNLVAAGRIMPGVVLFEPAAIFFVGAGLIAGLGRRVQ